MNLTDDRRLDVKCACGAVLTTYVNARDQGALEAATWLAEIAIQKHLTEHREFHHAVRR